MNDKLQSALAELATKLGTTVQYLWGVLLRQSKVFIFEVCLSWVLLLSIGWVLWALHRKFIKEDEDNNTLYETNEILPVIMIISLVAWVGCLIACVVYSFDMINAIYNPEYWALKQIIG